MRVKYLIPFLILILVFGFGLASCEITESEKVSNLEQELESKNNEIKELKKELRITKIDLELIQKELDRKIKEVIIEKEIIEELLGGEIIREDIKNKGSQ